MKRKWFVFAVLLFHHLDFETFFYQSGFLVFTFFLQSSFMIFTQDSYKSQLLSLLILLQEIQNLNFLSLKLVLYVQ